MSQDKCTCDPAIFFPTPATPRYRVGDDGRLISEAPQAMAMSLVGERCAYCQAREDAYWAERREAARKARADWAAEVENVLAMIEWARDAGVVPEEDVDRAVTFMRERVTYPEDW